MGEVVPVGRFAPSPTGRMHLGNIFTAVLSWLSVKSRGGRWILRIEDLDPQRSRREWAERMEEDLRWLGLDWDEGGLQGIGMSAPCMQSLRGDIYEQYFKRLTATGNAYSCRCTRADLMAVNAPHQSDGRLIYPGTCRPTTIPCAEPLSRGCAVRLYVPDEDICYTDAVFGAQRVNLSQECGDFILRRADGAWSYQLAVVVDDALMGVNEVVRGCDLLLSAAQQIYISRLLDLREQSYMHLPLVSNRSGQRLSKRDSSLSMEALRIRFTPEELLGRVGWMAGLLASPRPVTLSHLLERYAPGRIAGREKIIVDFM